MFDVNDQVVLSMNLNLEEGMDIQIHSEESCNIDIKANLDKRDSKDIELEGDGNEDVTQNSDNSGNSGNDDIDAEINGDGSLEAYANSHTYVKEDIDKEGHVEIGSN